MIEKKLENKDEIKKRIALLKQSCDENNYSQLSELLFLINDEKIEISSEVLEFFENNRAFKFSELTTGVFKIFLRNEKKEKTWYEIIFRIEKEFGRDSNKM